MPVCPLEECKRCAKLPAGENGSVSGISELRHKKLRESIPQ
jgi:hypothetical protein